jgi:hypothetical protein
VDAIKLGKRRFNWVVNEVGFDKVDLHHKGVAKGSDDEFLKMASLSCRKSVPGHLKPAPAVRTGSGSSHGRRRCFWVLRRWCDGLLPRRQRWGCHQRYDPASRVRRVSSTVIRAVSRVRFCAGKPSRKGASTDLGFRTRTTIRPPSTGSQSCDQQPALGSIT